jgi:Tfp pilus assembly protein PilX
MNTATRNHRPQRGVATLVVVMVLFFIATMVAAYASRNMVFEQRTGANYYRATTAAEVAEAGLQWALGQLNSGRINDACVPSASSTDASFRERFLRADAATGQLQPRSFTAGAGAASTLAPACEFNPTTATWTCPASCVFNPDTLTWACSCPLDAAPSLTAPTTGRVAPAFRVRFDGSFGSASALTPGLIAITVTACTRMDEACLSPSGAGLANEGRAVVRTLLYQSGLSTPTPLAALTVRGDITATGLTVTNARFGDSGLAVQASGSIGSGVVLNTLAGNALGGAGTRIDMDSTLDLPDLSGTVPVSGADRFFATVFNLLPQTARRQPAMVDLGNCSGGCDDTDLEAAAAAHPGRPLWVEGDLALDTGVTIGTPTEPVVLIVNGGQLSISASDAVIHGLVFVRAPAGGWSLPDAGRVVGAVVVDGDVVGSGGLAIEYDGNVLKAVRSRTGSFIPVPGAWRDSPRP